MHNLKKTSILSYLERRYFLKIAFHAFVSVFRSSVFAFLARLMVVGYSKVETGGEVNFLGCLPWVKILFGVVEVSRLKFAMFASSLVIVFFLLYVWEQTLENELTIKGREYTKQLILNKSRKLPFLYKRYKKQEVANTLSECVNFSHLWESVIVNCFANVWSVFFVLALCHEDVFSLNLGQILFVVGWSFLILLVAQCLTKGIKTVQNKKHYLFSKENEVVSYEQDNSVLIDSMGLGDEFRKRQAVINKKKVKFELKNGKRFSLQTAVPEFLLKPLLPFLLLFFRIVSLASFNTVLQIISHVLNSASSFKGFTERKISLKKIESFLSLPEKDDNLKGVTLTNDVRIERIILQKIYFRYSETARLILKGYNSVFINEKINFLIGRNGSGKSTIVYLLLGMLSPEKGKITVELNNGIKHDLSEINLLHWRSHNVAYMSHENLFERDFGSTGERQLANIKEQLVKKRDAMVWVLDECGNALDTDKQKWLDKKVLELSNEGKIVIFITHKKRDDFFTI